VEIQKRSLVRVSGYLNNFFQGAEPDFFSVLLGVASSSRAGRNFCRIVGHGVASDPTDEVMVLSDGLYSINIGTLLILGIM
jgi:hypothetical protein